MRAPRAESPDGIERRLRPYVSRLLSTWDDGVPWRTLDGTLSFVDISGFTSLTERLARRGKVGAEELNDILDRCFSELLGVARQYGADLVKWGGDAVLLLFDGAEHATRGVESALAMQREMVRVGRIRSSAGSARLRMSVGVHSGTLHFVRAGDAPVDLLPIGPGVTRTVAMETIAEAGEVAISPEAAAQLSTAARPGLIRDGALIQTRAPSAPPPTAFAGAEAPVGDLGRFLAPSIRKHLLADYREAEHRQVAVGFLEFSRTDELLADQGPEALAEALQSCLTVAQEAALQHGVTYLESDIAKSGAKVLLVAGAPTSAGDDEERMVRVAKAVVDAAPPLPVRAGIATGRVFTGDFGPLWRRTFSIKGDAVNLAARIMARADVGQVLAANDALERSRRSFEALPLEPFPVKGKQLLVHASAIGQLRTDESPGPVDSAPMYGRDLELEELTAALDGARRGTGAAVTVLGEAGSGKTRLVDALLSGAEDASVLRVACQEYDSAVPYRPFRQLLRRLLGIEVGTDATRAGERLAAVVREAAPDLEPWLPLLAVPLSADVPATPEVDGLAPQFRAERLIEVVQLLLTALLPKPAVLVVEDVQWIDAASAELLNALGEAAAILPWLVLTTQRAGAGQVLGGATLQLLPLGGDALASIAEAVAEHPLAPHEVVDLVRRSGGNPLFLTQLARAFAAGGDMNALPDSVDKLLTAQIDRLEPAERRVLRYAAVIGVSASLRLLRRTLHDQVPLTTRTWERLREFIHIQGGEARFRSALVREVAYEGLPFSRRRALHALVGEAIEQAVAGDPGTAAGILSLHFLYAQRFQPAWRYAKLAGAQALQIYANVEARTLHRRALDAAAHLRGLPPREVADAWEGLGTAHVRLGEFAKARRAFQTARRRGELDPVAAAELRAQEAQTWYWAGSHRAALRTLGVALRSLEGMPGQAAAGRRARLYLLYAAVRLQQGRSSEAAEWCRRAIPEAEHAADRASLAIAYEFLDSALILVGRYDEARHGETALATIEGLGQLDLEGRILNNLGVAAHVQGRWPEALAYYSRAEDAWKRAGNHFVASFPAGNIGLLLVCQGHLEEADRILDGALRVARASRSSLREAPLLLSLGILSVRTGRLEAAAEQLEMARAGFAAEGNAPWVVMAEARLAELQLYLGLPRAALELAAEALAHADATEDLYALRAILHRVRATALLQLREYREAIAAAELAADEARRKRDPYELALALRARGVLAEVSGEEALGYAREVASLCEQLGVVSLPELPLPHTGPKTS